MREGCLVAVVGPSGVGKDSVMTGLRVVLPQLHLVRRVITRAADLGGEDYDAVSDGAFEAMVEDGAFLTHWRAHGLCYGIPTAIEPLLHTGTDCLANLSRSALAEVARAVPRFVVLNITAAPKTLATRLAARGRETQDDIATRLRGADKPLPTGLDVIHLSNDGHLQDTVARGAALLMPLLAASQSESMT